MSLRYFLTFIVLAFAFVTSADSACGEQMGFRFAPMDASGRLRLIPAGPNGTLGWRASWAGGARTAVNQQPRPTHTVNYRHPYSGCCVQVPLQLPEGTPNVEYVGDRLVYNYGTYTVSIRFLSDGNVETIYNSGLFRPLHIFGT